MKSTITVANGGKSEDAERENFAYGSTNENEEHETLANSRKRRMKSMKILQVGAQTTMRTIKTYANSNWRKVKTPLNEEHETHAKSNSNEDVKLPTRANGSQST